MEELAVRRVDVRTDDGPVPAADAAAARGQGEQQADAQRPPYQEMAGCAMDGGGQPAIRRTGPWEAAPCAATYVPRGR